VGKDATGKDYVARTTDEVGVTDRDLQILAVGNRDTSTPTEFVKYYEKQRDDYNTSQADAMMPEYMEAADRTVRAGLHLSESRVGYSSNYARAWDEYLERENDGNEN
jgi:hypothetical protein